MMGTPAYMAPEQFLGTATDARTDQFSFCVALYEALYGERPFGGNTMYALTNNVVQGKVREAPANAKVPLWMRKILLRGLRPDRRRPLSVDGRPCSTRWERTRRCSAGRWRRSSTSALIPGMLAVGIKQSMADHRATCGGGPARLAGVWELWRPGEPVPARHTRIKKRSCRRARATRPTCTRRSTAC